MGVWYRLVLGVLVTWRVTHLLHAEDGPWRMLARTRDALSRIDMLRQLFDCFYCLSLWVAAPFAFLLGDTWTERALLVPALSAGAILLERLTAEPPMPHYVEDPEVPDELLWKRTHDGESDDAGAEP